MPTAAINTTSTASPSVILAPVTINSGPGGRVEYFVENPDELITVFIYAPPIHASTAEAVPISPGKSIPLYFYAGNAASISGYLSTAGTVTVNYGKLSA